MHEVFDHTADLGLRIRAATLDELFAEAARGLFSAIVENLADVRPVVCESMEVAGEDRDYLLFDWLTELLFLFESRKLLLSEFQVTVRADGLSAMWHGEPFDPARHRLEHEIKAITYHGLKVESVDNAWLAEVIIDI